MVMFSRIVSGVLFWLVLVVCRVYIGWFGGSVWISGR